jgi:hypothetical protein
MAGREAGFMRGGIVALALLVGLTGSPALSAKWRASSSKDEIVAYIDTDAIRRKGDQVSFWRELRWPGPQTLGNGVRYDRMAALFRANCRSMTFRSLRNRLLFDAKDDNDEIHIAEPGSNGEADLRAACFGDWKTVN